MWLSIHATSFSISSLLYFGLYSILYQRCNNNSDVSHVYGGNNHLHVRVTIAVSVILTRNKRHSAHLQYDVMNDAVTYQSDNDACKRSAHYISRIMNSEIYARKRCNHCPHKHTERNSEVLEQHRYIYGNRKCVGGVARNEAVQSAAIIINSIYHIHYHWVVRRTKAHEVRLAQRRCKLVSQKHRQSQKHEDYRNMLHLVVSDNGN